MLALDVGKKRIGLAISDELGITAQGLETWHRKRIREDLAMLKELIGRLGIRQLVVGKPIHMSGSDSRQSEYTREFAERVGQELGIAITYWDERLTSVEAERLMRDAGATLEQRKKSVDRMSATLILQSYLENARITAAELPADEVDVEP